ncbi:MAG: antitoxin Xre/MbcA/ParS toxin-binding domain-containing protein [Bacteroidota bacterium]
MSNKSNRYNIPETSPTSVAEALSTYHSPTQKIHLSRTGLSPDFVVDLITSYHFNKQETSKLVDISTKTLDRHIQSGKRFTGLKSDRLLELAELYGEGTRIFGSRDKFLNWLSSKIPALGHTTPKEWLDTHKGIALISDELGRIEHGIFG